jgi:hypothetical protein
VPGAEEVIDLDDVPDEEAVKSEGDVSNSAEMVRSRFLMFLESLSVR